MASATRMAFHVNCSVPKPSVLDNFDHFKTKLSSSYKPFLGELKRLSMQIDVSKTMKNAYVNILDAFVDSVFQFVDQPMLPSQSNFAPVDELKETILISSIEGKVPDDFPEGAYIRNGPNPLFGGLKSTTSMFGKTGNVWIEGEGMLHVLYLDKDSDGRWSLLYTNRHVETETLKLEKQRNKPSFLPAIEGHSPAVVLSILLNLMRFGKVYKYLSNTNVFKHSGKFYSIAENHIPQEFDIFSLKTLGNWDVNGAWNRPFTAHPKRAPRTGELVIMGMDAIKPFMQLGIVSADGKRLVHKVDLKYNRCSLCHDMGVTERYNVIMDFPLKIDILQLIKGSPLITYNKEDYARIGIMPRYGDADSIQWFEVEPNCTFHVLNCFEDGDEVVVWGCRSLESVITIDDMDLDKFQWVSGRLRRIQSDEQDVKFSTKDELLFCRCHEWRLNMRTKEVKERNLTGNEFSMEFPMINENFTGVKNKYGYTQVVDAIAGATSGMPKFGALAKLYFEEPDPREGKQFEGLIKVEYHQLEENTFCTGASFVPKEGGLEEDDGWIITFVHNEDTNTSKVYIIDTKKFSSEPVAKITLPCRVPYGFHGAFMPIPSNTSTMS